MPGPGPIERDLEMSPSPLADTVDPTILSTVDSTAAPAAKTARGKKRNHSADTDEDSLIMESIEVTLLNQSPVLSPLEPIEDSAASQRSLTNLPPEVLHKIFSNIQSVPQKCKMRLVNKRWNGLLRHDDSFAASTSLDLNISTQYINGLSSSGCGVVVEDESGRLFEKLSLSLPDFFDKFLPNLKLITSLRLNNIHRGSTDQEVDGISIPEFIHLLYDKNPGNVQLTELSSLPKPDDCVVSLRLDVRKMAHLHRTSTNEDLKYSWLAIQERRRREFSWLGAVEHFEMVGETDLRSDSLRKLAKWLTSMRRLRSLSFKRFMKNQQFPLQIDGQKELSDWFFHRLITKSPPGVFIEIEKICDQHHQTSPPQHISSKKHFIQRIEQEVANMNEEFKDCNVTFECQDGYEYHHEHWPDSMCHIRCCLKIEKGGEKLRHVDYVFRLP